MLTRDAHLPYLDWVAVGLLRGQAQTVSELYQLLRVDPPFDRIDHQLIWRWLASAERRGIAIRVTGQRSSTGEQLWRPQAGHQPESVNALARARVAAPLASQLAAVLGLVGGTAYIAVALGNPVLAGFLAGVVGVAVDALVGVLRLRSRATVYRIIERERNVQTRARAMTLCGGKRPSDERVELVSRRVLAYEGSVRLSAWWIYLTVLAVTFAIEALLVLMLGVEPSGQASFNAIGIGLVMFWYVASTVLARALYDRAEVKRIRARWGPGPPESRVAHES